MKPQSSSDRLNDCEQMKTQEENKIIVSNIALEHGFDTFNSLDNEALRFIMIRDASTLLDEHPDNEEVEGYFRLVARAGVLDPDIVVRSNAFVCLADLHDEVDLCWLLSGLNDVDADVRAVCVQGIRWIEKKSNAKYVLPLLRDRAVEVRGLVILSVPELLSKPKAAKALYDHLSMEKNPTLRAICYYFLLSKSLADKDLEAKVKMELNAEPQSVRSRTEKLKSGKDPDELLSEL